jgi:hypothetical protein
MLSMSITILYEDKAYDEIFHNALPPAPEIGTTVVIYQPVDEGIIPQSPLLEKLAQRNPKIIYKPMVSIKRLTANLYIKLVYWGAASSWNPNGSLELYLEKPSEGRLLIKRYNIRFPNRPPSSTEVIKVAEVPIPLNILNEDGVYVLQLIASVNLTLKLETGVIQRAKGVVEAIFVLKTSDGKVMPMLVAASKDWFRRDLDT